MVPWNVMKSYWIVGVFIFTMFWACSSKSVSQHNEQTPPSIGESLFKKNCKVCHGKDGRKGLGGASDITESSLSVAERIQLITKGKGNMAPFENILSPDEIKAVAEYTNTLK